MKTTRKAKTIVIALFEVCAVCFAQTDPKNVPQPPTAELRKFDPFLGKYQVSGEFANLPWTGSLELKTVRFPLRQPIRSFGPKSRRSGGEHSRGSIRELNLPSLFELKAGNFYVALAGARIGAGARETVNF